MTQERQITPKVLFHTQETDLDEGGIQAFVADYSKRLGFFAGVDLSNLRLKTINIHDRYPRTFVAKLRKRLGGVSYPDAYGFYNPIFQSFDTHTVDWMNEGIARGIGEAALRQPSLGGNHLERPAWPVREVFIDMTGKLYCIWFDGPGTIEAYQQQLRQENPGAKLRFLQAIKSTFADETHYVNGKKVDPLNEMLEIALADNPKAYEAEHSRDFKETTYKTNWHTLHYGSKEFFIFLLASKDKDLFHKFLRSTTNLTPSDNITKSLERFYETSLYDLKRQCANWWYG